MDFDKTFSQWTQSPAEIDALDSRILDLLRGDARLSARAIAKAVSKSPGAVLERIGRLEREGVIRGYTTQIDPARVGVGMLAIVGVQCAHDFSLAAMVEQLQAIPECDRIYVVTGNWDLLIHLQVRDQYHLAEVIFGEVWTSAGFRHSETMVVLHQQETSLARLAARAAEIEEQPEEGVPTGK